MNLVPAQAVDTGLELPGGARLPMALPVGLAAAGPLTLGLRASALRLQARPGDVALQGVVELAEISGSDTFVHATTPWGELVAQVTGVHHLDLGSAVTLHLDPAHAYVFGTDGALLLAPARPGGR